MDMLIRHLTTCLLLFTLMICSPTKLLAKISVVGYLPDYRISGIHAKQVKGVTDLIYFGIQPQANGQIPQGVIKTGVIKKLKSLQKEANCNLLICVGGWGRSEHFPALTADPASRKRLIANMLRFCIQHGFNGVDYDWEHPKNEKQMSNYQALVIETAAAFRPKKLQVTIAQASWQNIGLKAYQALDRVHLMSYDHPFPQSSYEKSSKDVEQLIQWGCPARKISLGIPFYGQNKARESRSYSDLMNGTKLAPHVDVIDGFAFNGKATITRKIQLVQSKKLSGLMIWELSHDATEKSHSLLQHILSQP